MKRNTINILISVLSIFSVQRLLAQENKFLLSIEYSPNCSKITDEVVNEKYKLSHNALIRIEYNTKGKIKPSLGLGYLNTGELEKSEIGGQQGIEEVKFIHNYNYLFIPIGVIIKFGKFYFLPEIGLGVNISNKTRQITKFTNGETEKETRDETLISGEFNKLSIPLSLSVARQISIGGKSFSTGCKGYYGINKVVRDVPRNNHYFGLGVLLAMNL